MEIAHTAAMIPYEYTTRLVFPIALYQILERAQDGGYADIVSWTPCGTAFKIHKREEFVSSVLPQFFTLTKYKSFSRQLNLWGYTCIEVGPFRGAYYHPSFQRGDRDSCKLVRRQKAQRKSLPDTPKSADLMQMASRNIDQEANDQTIAGTTRFMANELGTSEKRNSLIPLPSEINQLSLSGDLFFDLSSDDNTVTELGHDTSVSFQSSHQSHYDAEKETALPNLDDIYSKVDLFDSCGHRKVETCDEFQIENPGVDEDWMGRLFHNMECAGVFSLDNIDTDDPLDFAEGVEQHEFY